MNAKELGKLARELAAEEVITVSEEALAGAGELWGEYLTEAGYGFDRRPDREALLVFLILYERERDGKDRMLWLWREATRMRRIALCCGEEGTPLAEEEKEED